MRYHTIPAPDGTRIHVADTEATDRAPIVFIHGWSQSHLSWHKQLESPLAREFRLIAPDLRGHGDSDKPPDGYTDGSIWAGDLQAIIDTLALRRPVLVGWSYGGLVLNDMLRYRPETDLAGLCYVGAATDLGIETAYSFLGSSWNGLMPERPDSLAGTVFSHDDEEIARAMRLFIRGCFAKPLPCDEEALMLGFNLRCPSRVRGALLSRSVANDDVLARINVPVLVVHGTGDEVVRIDTGRHIASMIPGAKLSAYEGAGHAPFWEETERFNHELGAFAALLPGPDRSPRGSVGTHAG
jgi:pimeloyl-ACP methyl ester carboxylesterase